MPETSTRAIADSCHMPNSRLMPPHAAGAYLMVACPFQKSTEAMYLSRSSETPEPPSSTNVLRSIVMGCMGSSKSASCALMEMIPVGGEANRHTACRTLGVGRGSVEREGVLWWTLDSRHDTG